MNQKVKKVRQSLVAVVILAALAGFTSCEKYKFTAPSVDPLETWHFQDDIQPIFSANCVVCHGGTRAPDLRVGNSYNALTKGGFVSAPYDKSRLYAKLENSHPSSSFSVVDKLKIQYWILQGAKNN
jgi:hypothetical protein